MEQEANTETLAHFTHSPEQECGEPLSKPRSKQDLEERVKQLENEVRTLKKLLQITTSKGQKAITYWMKQCDDTKEENNDLKKKIDALNDLYMQQVEDEMKRINVGEDKVDGSDVLTIPDDILPLVRKAFKPNFYWRNPFGCMAGCTMSATHFALSDGWKKRLCELKFARVVQKKVDELSKLQQSTEIPKEKVICSSMKDILDIGLVKFHPDLSGDFHNVNTDDLQRCIEHLKLGEKALIVIRRDDGLSHCMAIYKCSDQSKPNARVEIFDVQSGKLWPRSPQHVTVVKGFRIYIIEESMKEEFEKECSILLCISERKCACLQQLPQQTPDQI